jgi:hypothetical protein
LAQDGELVEPFVICLLVLEIFPIQPAKLSQKYKPIFLSYL